MTRLFEPTGNEPEPLVAAGVDLRDMPSMMLDVARLRDSDFASLPPEAFQAGILLWCAAWHHVPAGTLPNDLDKLTRLAGLGRSIRTFQKAVKLGALSGFSLCSDGFLHHKTLAEKVADALISRDKQRAKTASATRARLSRRKQIAEKAANGTHVTSTASAIDTSHVPNADSSVDTSSNRTEQNRSTYDDKNHHTPSLDPLEIVWRDGLALLADITHRSDATCRKLLGKLLRDARNDPERLMAALRDAEKKRPSDPVSWIAASIKSREPPDPRSIWARYTAEWARGDDGQDHPVVAGFHLDEVRDFVLGAARMDLRTDIDLTPLVDWLRDDIPSAAIIDAVKRVASQPRYRPPASLRYFDRPVRESRPP